jgi:general secretion pathway protein C
MDAWLKRNFWVVVVVLGAVSTYFFAAGATQIVAGKYLPLDPAAVTPHAVNRGPSGAGSAVPPRVVSAREILETNPFDSVTGPIRELPPPSITIEQPISNDSGERLFSQCAGPTKLSITIVDPNNPKLSFAVFSTGEGSANKPMVREGGTVAGKEVAVIVREKVYFKEGSSYCFIGMFLPPPPPAPPTPQIPQPGVVQPLPGGAPAPIDPIIEKGIQKIDDTNFNVDRIVVDKIIENQAELMKTARIVPEQQNGKTVGIRLLNIRPDTLLGKLGLQNGDVLRTINGFDMTSPEKALEAYAKLRTAPEIVIGVNRGDKPTNIVFNIK